MTLISYRDRATGQALQGIARDLGFAKTSVLLTRLGYEVPEQIAEAFAAGGGIQMSALYATSTANCPSNACVGPPGPPGATVDVLWVGPSAPADPLTELWYDTDEPTPPPAMSGVTVDTGEAYRIIMFSDGTVRAIPEASGTPALPTALARVVRVNSVKLTWTAAAGATTYAVLRDGVQYAIATTNSYRDVSVVVGETYTYAVQAISAYGLRSAATATVSAFIDPTLNITPTVEVRAWPTTVAAGNRAVIRVNAIDPDAQVLALTLGVDAGSLVATADPSVWILEP